MGRKSKGEDYVSRAAWLLDKVEAMQLSRRAIVVEIGVWKADFSDVVLYSRGDLMIQWIGVDPFRYYPEKRRKAKNQAAWDFIFARVQAKVSKWHGNYKLIRALSSEALPEIKKSFGGIDFLFVDGDHSSEAVLSDLKLYAPLVRAGGIVAGHDYQLETIKQAVNEYAKIVRREPVLEQFVEGQTFWWKQTKASKKLGEGLC